MNDAFAFASGFWGGWVALLTAIGLVFVAALWIASKRGDVRAESEVWDETLREGDATPPSWWYFLFVALLIFSCVYLVLYPGFGAWRGALGWTQFGQYEQAQEHYRSRYGERYARWEAAPFDEIAKDADAMRAASLIFADNCAACHGADGRGQAAMFPDLTDGEWQWGGLAEQIHASIAEGRIAQMPSQTAALGGMEAAEAMADYVLALAGLSAPAESNDAAAAQFAQVCAACHGADGKGLSALGAPDLTDSVWLYGDSREAILESIVGGRSGVMPAQNVRLSPARVRILAAWLASGKIKEFPPR